MAMKQGMSGKVEKSKQDRAKECVVVLDKIIRELELPSDNPSIQLFAKRMADYTRAESSRCIEDRIPLVGSDRYIVYRFPRWSHQIIEVVLRKGRIDHVSLPEEFAKEVADGALAIKELEALDDTTIVDGAGQKISD
jgi:hypothetical protein